MSSRWNRWKLRYENWKSSTKVPSSRGNPTPGYHSASSDRGPEESLHPTTHHSALADVVADTWITSTTPMRADTVERLEVEVGSARGWSRCRRCGFRCYRVWDRRAKRVRDLEVSGRRTTLVWRRRRFARCLVADATVMSIRAVARHHGVGVASDHGVGESPLGCGGAASPGPAVSCAVGGRDFDPAPASVCDRGGLW